jgi:hypothetical protein
MRYVIAKICVDDDGHYSVDTFSLEQGGSVGLGTESCGDGPKNFDGTGELIKAKLAFFHDYIMGIVSKEGKHDDQTT